MLSIAILDTCALHIQHSKFIYHFQNDKPFINESEKSCFNYTMKEKENKPANLKCLTNVSYQIAIYIYIYVVSFGTCKWAHC